jgi:hypothetical protein
MGRRPIHFFPMTTAERKARQRAKEKAKRDQAAFEFNRSEAPHNVTSNVTISTPTRGELACFSCGKKPGAVEFMFVRASDGFAVYSKCAERADAWEELEDAMMTMLLTVAEDMSAIKIDVEQLAAEVENQRRKGLVPEAEQAFSVAAQQHLEAVISELDAILDRRIS